MLMRLHVMGVAEDGLGGGDEVSSYLAKRPNVSLTLLCSAVVPTPEHCARHRQSTFMLGRGKIILPMLPRLLSAEC